MRCPFCSHTEDKVVDSRESKDGDSIRRRRECLGCGRRFTSYERIDEIPYMVVKKDGKRESWDRNKVLSGLFRAAGHCLVYRLAGQIEVVVIADGKARCSLSTARYNQARIEPRQVIEQRA